MTYRPRGRFKNMRAGQSHPLPLGPRRAAGTNPRALGTNPRALGTNPRAIGVCPPSFAATGVAMREAARRQTFRLNTERTVAKSCYWGCDGRWREVTILATGGRPTLTVELCDHVPAAETDLGVSDDLPP